MHLVALKKLHDVLAFDVLRGFALFTAVCLIVMLLVLIFRPRKTTNLRGDRLWCFWGVGYCVLAIAQESGQIGKPLLWWRLPLILLVNIVGLLAITMRLREEVRVESANTEQSSI